MKTTLLITDSAAFYTQNIFVEVERWPADRRRKKMKGWVYHPVRKVVVYIPGLNSYYEFDRLDLEKLAESGKYRRAKGQIDDQGYLSVGVLIPLQDIQNAKRAKFAA